MAQTSIKKPELEKELEKKLSSIKKQQDEDNAKALAQKMNLPYLSLKSFPIDNDAILLVDEKDARAGQIAIITKKGKAIRVAVSNPENPRTITLLEKLKNEGYDSNVVIVSGQSLASAWRRYELKKKRLKAPTGVVEIKESEIANLESQIKGLADLKEQLTALPITKVLNMITAGALKVGASDVHLEPEENVIRLRYRLDGVLSDIVDFSSTGYPNILSRIKLLSGLKINVHNVPQDGRFTIRQEGRDIEVRVSILPGAYGENIVMRLLDPATIRQKLEDLGMRDDTLDKIKKLLQKTTGAILTTGPTGSGKTTTLYAFLRHVNSPDVKIITIEDPIEYHIKGVSQTQVNASSGYTFAKGLRSIVRQDPDIILVGEIRDAETAEITMQASLTGHAVFSTLHTNNAAGTVPRLVDFGVKPITISPALNAAMAQRLVRRLCENCKKKQKIAAPDLELLKKYLTNIPKGVGVFEMKDSLEIYYSQGCEECNGTGYKGRTGVYELFEVDEDMEKLIFKSPAISEVEDLAKKKGMITLLQDGLIKVIKGITSIDEVLRVVGE